MGLSQDVIDDAELIQEHDDAILFDYRLKRNPTYFYSNTKFNSDKRQIHLYRSNPVLTIEADSVYIPNELSPVKGFYKLDLQLRPFVYAEFGDFRESLRTQVGLAPRVSVGYSGLYGIFQWMFPVQDDFPDRFGFGNRPGEIGVGYSTVYKGINYINSFAGTFINDRYGAYVEYIRSLKDARIYIGSSFYYTGRIVYEEGVFYRDLINYFSGNAFFLYRFLRPNVSVRVSYERFLRNDHGLVIELFRQFGNTDIGFSVIDSQNGSSAGLFVAISLGGKFYSNKWSQIRLPHSFRYVYDLKPNTGIAERTRPFTDFFFDIYRFNKYYISSQLTK